jgi:hypothetical protein
MMASSARPVKLSGFIASSCTARFLDAPGKALGRNSLGPSRGVAASPAHGQGTGEQITKLRG